MPTSRALTILLLILFIPLAKGCSIIFNADNTEPQIGVPTPFEGCWEGPDWGGIHLHLEEPGEEDDGGPDLLDGFLLINLGGGSTEDFTAYSVEGEVKSDGLAILQGTNSSIPAQQNEITVLLITGNDTTSADDTVTLQINNGPPSAPLTRCP